MKAILAEGLDGGRARAVVPGLVYDPGRFAATDELVELASLMRGTGALYATHMRDEGTGLLDSVREALAIGTGAGVPVQISHHKASGRTAWGLVRESLKLIEAAQRRGQQVQADQYPYTAGSTILSAVYRDGKLRGVIGDLKRPRMWSLRRPRRIRTGRAGRWRSWALRCAARPNRRPSACSPPIPASR